MTGTGRYQLVHATWRGSDGEASVASLGLPLALANEVPVCFMSSTPHQTVRDNQQQHIPQDHACKQRQRQIGQHDSTSSMQRTCAKPCSTVCTTFDEVHVTVGTAASASAFVRIDVLMYTTCMLRGCAAACARYLS
jgi:hypothetical protein